MDMEEILKGSKIYDYNFKYDMMKKLFDAINNKNKEEASKIKQILLSNINKNQTTFDERIDFCINSLNVGLPVNGNLVLENLQKQLNSMSETEIKTK